VSTCAGTPLCNMNADCPPSRTDRVQPVCQSNGDVIVNGASGHCILPCANSGDCPSPMQCVAQRCVFVTFDPNTLCSSDEDCAIQSGYRCARQTCNGEARCHLNDAPCQLNQPVCGCDGHSYPDACSAFPVAVAHEGMCP
jgi:hypothetical protein